jgi:hypothetical protein
LSTNGTRRARAAGLLAGLLLAAAVLAGWRVAPGGQPLGLDLAVTANSTGELALGSTGRIGAATGLAPGRTLEAETTVTNQTGRTLAVRVRALRSSRDLDRALRIRVSVGDRPTMRLAPGASAPIRLKAWVATGSSGWRGRIEDITLEPESKVAR